MSEKLNTYFENKPVQDLEKKLDTLEPQIHPAFIEQFDDYRSRLLGIIGDPNNARVISDTSVQNAINLGNNKIGEAFSGHKYSLQVEKAVSQAANDTSWEQVA